ncbi:TLP-20 [Plodia interpunctella granulovirus]|uniref:TLP-20 n=1 Tax=Plodia interpunctella granulovirus TaxID=262175 RepID=A0A1L5JGP8_9BBAC|nr:TLP-20 [Plodia interpunctella granulovirus]APO13973.1 TLP-20 [Plodia interpunctella granulovirus]
MMTNNIVETDNITVYCKLEHENRLEGRVKYEYNLKKLGIGAYKLFIENYDNVAGPVKTANSNFVIVVNEVYEKNEAVGVLILLDDVMLRANQTIFVVEGQATRPVFEVPEFDPPNKTSLFDGYHVESKRER